jgi:hypothetical protein
MDMRLSKAIRRIVVLAPNEGETVTVYKGKKRKKKKGSRLWRPLEKTVRRLTKANRKYIGTYRGRHNKSNRKKKNGWLRDFNYNVLRATEKQAKALKIPMWF